MTGSRTDRGRHRRDDHVRNSWHRRLLRRGRYGMIGMTMRKQARPTRRHGVAPSPLRRVLDVVVAAGGLLIGGGPLLLLMAAVRLDSSGPALFRQIRLGQGGLPFTMYKLRTMRVDTAGPEVTAHDDARLTRIGRWLRRTSLDEIPQLWNVLRGEMTLVGPRPETPGLALGYPVGCRWVFAYRPGLTGPAQVRLRNVDGWGPTDEIRLANYFARVVPARTALDARYLAKPTLAATFGVLADTARHLVGRPPRHC
jgi:lipopolysaccharide/colanic/teichoic acid biosynthesis glycosyltransferase